MAAFGGSKGGFGVFKRGFLQLPRAVVRSGQLLPLRLLPAIEQIDLLGLFVQRADGSSIQPG